MKHMLRLAGIMLVMIGVAYGAVIDQPQTTYAFSYDGTMQMDCDGFVANDASAFLDRDNTGLDPPQEHFFLIAWDGAGNIIWFQEDTTPLAEKVNGIGVSAWQSPPQYNPLTFQAISAAGNGLPEEIGFEATGTCDGLPFFEDTTPVVEEPVPGCDVSITIPDGSVVGAFVADAATYYAPGMLIEPTVTIPAGKTAWVLGTDASGAYTKIVWVCDYLWVPSSSIGPNYDAVWNGAPLPTGVVE